MDRLPQSEIIVVHSGGGAEKEPAALGKLELLPLLRNSLVPYCSSSARMCWDTAG